MAFFRSRTVNLLNLHYGIHAIALSGGGAFFAVYLLKSGVSIPWVLASLALILAGRFIIRPIVVPIAVRSGMRALVIAGTCLTALQYPLLAEVHGLGIAAGLGGERFGRQGLPGAARGQTLGGRVRSRRRAHGGLRPIGDHDGEHAKREHECAGHKGAPDIAGEPAGHRWGSGSEGAGGAHVASRPGLHHVLAGGAGGEQGGRLTGA